MKIRHNIVRILAVAALSSGALLGGCGRRVQRNPPLTKVPDTPEKPAQKGFLDKAADTTWNVVSAPVRWVSPRKKPLEPQEPEVYEPPGLIIVRPGQPLTPPPGAAASQPSVAPSN